MNNETGERKGWLRRISLRVKVIAVLIVLVMAALALVVAFASGFAVGTMLSETSRRDACAGKEGTWDPASGLCMQEAMQAEEQSFSAFEDAYSCGDGTKFALEAVSSTTERFTLAGAAPRDLAVVTEGVITRYEDDQVSIVPDGIDATYENRRTGAKVACTMVNPTVSQE